MAVQILPIVKEASHFDYSVLTAAVEKEMARLLHSGAGDSGSANRKVVGPGTFDHDLWTFLRAQRFLIGFKVEQRLLDKRSVAQRSLQAKFLQTAFQDGRNITTGGAGDVE